MPTDSAPTQVLDIWLLFKPAIILLSFFYLIFSVIVLRQVNLMTNTLITQLSPVLKTLAKMHVFISIGLLILTSFLLLG